VLGPILISYIIDSTGSYTTAFYIIAGMLLVSSILPIIVRPPRQTDEAPATEGARA
jgi:MFS-type transporter involved in bile tolerance (Atg22 family)